MYLRLINYCDGVYIKFLNAFIRTINTPSYCCFYEYSCYALTVNLSGIAKPSLGLVTPASYTSSNKAPSSSPPANQQVDVDNIISSADEVSTNTFSTQVASKMEQPSKIKQSKTEQSSKITPPKTSNLPASKLTPPKPTSSSSNTTKTSPSTARKIPLPSGQTRRASDSTLGLQTKSRLEVGKAEQNQKQPKIKKLSDLSRNDSVIHEKDVLESSRAKSEIKGLKHPTVGGSGGVSIIQTPKYNSNTTTFETSNTNPTANQFSKNKVLKFQPNPVTSKPVSTESLKFQPNPVTPKPVSTESRFFSDSISSDATLDGYEESDIDTSCDVTPTNEQILSEQNDISQNKNVYVKDDLSNENISCSDTLPIEFTDNELEPIKVRQWFGEMQTISDDDEDDEDELSISQNSSSHLPEHDPFSEFDNNEFDISNLTGTNDFDTSKLTGANNFDISQLTGIVSMNTTSAAQVISKVSSVPQQHNISKKTYRGEYDNEESDIDSDDPKSVCDDPDIHPKSIDDSGVVTMAGDETMKRSEQLSSDSGYIEPLEYLSSSRTSITNSTSGGLRKHSLTNAEDGSCYSSNESNPSPRFGDQNQKQLQVYWYMFYFYNFFFFFFFEKKIKNKY